MTNMTTRLLGALALLICTPACLDLKPAAPPAVRWLTLPAPEGVPGPLAGSAVQLGSVEASAAIDDRLILRPGPYELRYDEFVRWAVAPEASLRRAVEHELLMRRGAGNADFDAGPLRRVDLELEAFEEVTSPARAAGVTVRVVVVEASAGFVLATHRVRAEAPVDGVDPTATARAMATALADAASRIGELVGG